MASVTGAIASSGFGCDDGGGGSARPLGSSAPAAGGIHGRSNACSASAFDGIATSPTGRPFSASRKAVSSA
jgi:hypothetical protein